MNSHENKAQSNHRHSYNHISGQKIQRIEALSDGVFSIAMTLLVLDIRVPISSAVHTEKELLGGFLLLMPKLLSYFLSFMTLGIFWTGHSTQFSFVARSDRHLNWMSLFFLLFVSILPFTTAFLGEHITFKFAIALYWVNISLLSMALLVHWHYAEVKGYISLTGEEQKAVSKAIIRRIVTAQLLYTAGALLCFISTYLSIAVIILIQLNYALGLFSKRRKAMKIAHESYQPQEGDAPQQDSHE